MIPGHILGLSVTFNLLHDDQHSGIVVKKFIYNIPVMRVRASWTVHCVGIYSKCQNDGMLSLA